MQKNISGMFFDGVKLEDVSAINDWDVRNVTDFSGVFNIGTTIYPEFTKVSGTWEDGTFIKNS